MRNEIAIVTGAGRGIGAAVAHARGGEPEEVAAAVRWLVSGESSYVTGTNIDVTGGRQGPPGAKGCAAQTASVFQTGNGAALIYAFYTP